MKGLVECFSELGKNPIEVTPKYNKDGKLVQEIAIYKDGKKIDKCYDENGSLIRQITTSLDKNGDIRKHFITLPDRMEIDRVYDKNRKLKQEITTCPDGTEINLTYENNKFKQRITTSPYGGGVTYENFKNENLIQETTICPDGIIIDKYYDENGKVVQEITTHSEGIQEKEIIGIESSQEKVSDHLPVFKGRIEHSRLSSELKALFSAKQEKHQGLFYFTNGFKDNGSSEIANLGFHAMVNFLNTQKKNKNIVFEAFDNINDITLAPNNSQLRIISTSIPGHRFLLMIQSGKVQILDNGGLEEQEFIKIQEKLQKEGAITVEKTILKIGRDMRIENRGDCVLCAAAFMFKIFRMVEGLSYNGLVKPEFTTSKTQLNPEISFETIIQKLTDHTLNIHKVMANYALFYADKNQEEVNIDEKALNVYANDNNNLLMGCSINLLELSEQLKKQFSNQEKTPSTFRLAGGLTGLKKSF